MPHPINVDVYLNVNSGTLGTCLFIALGTNRTNAAAITKPAHRCLDTSDGLLGAMFCNGSLPPRARFLEGVLVLRLLGQFQLMCKRSRPHSDELL